MEDCPWLVLFGLFRYDGTTHSAVTLCNSLTRALDQAGLAKRCFGYRYECLPVCVCVCACVRACVRVCRMVCFC